MGNLRFWMPVPFGGGEHLSMTISIFLKTTMSQIKVSNVANKMTMFKAKWMMWARLFASAAPVRDPTSCFITSNSPWAANCELLPLIKGPGLQT